MTLMQVWGCLLILLVAPILGAISRPTWGDRHPRQQLAIELAKGIATIALTRYFFPVESPWELFALLALAMGSYWRSQRLSFGALVGGLLLHDWQTTLIVGFIGAVALTLFRQIRLGLWMTTALMVLALGAQHGEQTGYWGAAIALGGLVAWLSTQIPDNQRLWTFFRPEHHFRTLDRVASPAQVGQDAAILSQLAQLGYPVLPGWVLAAGDDLKGFIQFLAWDGDRRYMVRLSSEKNTHRLQIPIENITTPATLEAAILSAFIPEELGKQAILVQAQPSVLWSGITYSRPPLPFSRQEPFTEVVQDLITPLVVGDGTFAQYYGLERPSPVGAEAPRKPPSDVLIEAARLSRQLEQQWGSPQAMEWCFDGMQLWILRVRPVFHLHPVWTRDYIQDKFPQALRPLSASLLEQVAQGAIADLYQDLWQGSEWREVQFVSLHRSHVYLNRTFWEQVLQRENLQMSQLSLIRHARWQYALTHPLLFYRYVRWDWGWHGEFRQRASRYFLPTLKTLKAVPYKELPRLSVWELTQNLEQIVEIVQELLGYGLRGEVVLRGRRSLFNVTMPLQGETPQNQGLQQIARDIRTLIKPQGDRPERASLFARLAEMPDGGSIFTQLETWLKQYGYGADTPWEMAQRRWVEDAGSVRQRITEYVQQQSRLNKAHPQYGLRQRGLWQTVVLQQDIEDLSQQFLAQLRWHVLAIAKRWQQQGDLERDKDIFWLKLPEIMQLLRQPPEMDWASVPLKIQYRRSQFETNQAEPPPQVIYGQLVTREDVSSSCFLQKLQGQAASSGAVIGRVKLCPHWQQPPHIGDRDILVTPYLHEHLFPLLPQVKGIITTKGGMLSQGSSLVRQYRIPMVINVADALQKLHNGQWIRLDGRFGQVELLDPDTPSIDEA